MDGLELNMSSFWEIGYESEEAPLHDSEKWWSLTRQTDRYHLVKQIWPKKLFQRSWVTAKGGKWRRESETAGESERWKKSSDRDDQIITMTG